MTTPTHDDAAPRDPPPFQLDKFIAASRQIDLTGLDLDEAARYPLSSGEVRTIRFMQDTELFTVLYMKALMETRALADPEARAFLVMWGYEECSHGRALARLLTVCGHEPSRVSDAQFGKPRRWLEVVQDFGGRVASALSPDFLATHMTWGAVNELCAIQAYTRLGELTANPVLAELSRRLVKDERRHFAFYYQQARRRLAPRFAQRLAKFALRSLWAPVGAAITTTREDADFPSAYLFDDPAAQAGLREVDATIRRLPGMEWFDLVTPAINAQIDRIRRAGVPVERPRVTLS